jgi:hypothetical protein
LSAGRVRRHPKSDETILYALRRAVRFGPQASPGPVKDHRRVATTAKLLTHSDPKKGFHVFHKHPQRNMRTPEIIPRGLSYHCCVNYIHWRHQGTRDPAY